MTKFTSYAHKLRPWGFQKSTKFSTIIHTPVAVQLGRQIRSIFCLRFITIHYAYILLWAIVASVIIYPAGNVLYTDALFFGCAAATQSGLNTLNVNDLRAYQQVVILCVSWMTSPVFIHTAVVFCRIYWFEKRFQYLVQSAKTMRRTAPASGTSTNSSDEEQQNPKRTPAACSGQNLITDTYDNAAFNTERRNLDDNAAVSDTERALVNAPRDTTPYLSWNAIYGRNSAFVGLNEAQRDELGGIEYRALKTLAVILIVYYLFFHIFGIICLVPWIMESKTYGPIVRQVGLGRPWWAVFTAGSAFNDFGLTLTPDSMESFHEAGFPLLLMSFLIFIGNTAFPCMLRFIIWAVSKIVTQRTPLWAESQFLLDHPRRCFTLLFPQAATWWLFATVVLFNVVNMVVLVVLDVGHPVFYSIVLMHTDNRFKWNNPEIKAMSPGIRFVDSLFQAASTRTAGFSVVDISGLRPGTLVCYLVLMYISVFPIAISVRRTNVYEERSVGVYFDTEKEQGENSKKPSSVGIHLRRQLGTDLWYIFLGFFIISIVEGDRLSSSQEPSFTIFAVLFEIVSAYGTIGLSLGDPQTSTSFVGGFQTLSKLVIMAMQIRGRHRGLPYALDRSVLLPSESIHKSELAEAEQNIPLRQGSSGARPRPTDLDTRHFHAPGHQIHLPHGAVGEGEHAEHRLGIGTALSTLAGAR